MVSTGQFFDFIDFWALPGDSWFLIFLYFWNSPYKIVFYDTFIIFETALRSNVIRYKYIYRYKLLWSLEAYIIVLTTSYFIGFLFPGQIRLCTMYVCKQFMKQFFGWRYARFLFHINFSWYHWLQLIPVRTDSYRVRSDFIWMHVRIVFALS